MSLSPPTSSSHTPPSSTISFPALLPLSPQGRFPSACPLHYSTEPPSCCGAGCRPHGPHTASRLHHPVQNRAGGDAPDSTSLEHSPLILTKAKSSVVTQPQQGGCHTGGKLSLWALCTPSHSLAPPCALGLSWGASSGHQSEWLYLEMFPPRSGSSFLHILQGVGLCLSNTYPLEMCRSQQG